MIDPGTITQVPINTDRTYELHMDYIPEADYKVYDLDDEKSFMKYINDIEKRVRNSFEYRRFIDTLKTRDDMNKCAIIEDAVLDKDSKVKIEIHHHPFTLFDIVMIVYNKRLYNGESLELNMVAKEVLELHYKGMIGLIPLSTTVHKLFHNGFIFIPVDKVRFNWKAFMNEYYDFFNSEQKDVIERIIMYSSDYDEIKNLEVLQQKNITIDSSIDQYKLPDLSTVFNNMNNRIAMIKENHYYLPSASEEESQAIKTQQMQDHIKEEERKANLVSPIILLENPIIEIK